VLQRLTGIILKFINNKVERLQSKHLERRKEKIRSFERSSWGCAEMLFQGLREAQLQKLLSACVHSSPVLLGRGHNTGIQDKAVGPYLTTPLENRMLRHLHLYGMSTV